MNKVVIAGRMAKEPEMRSTSTGKAVANFSVAVDRRFKSDGQPTADFFNIVAWNKQAELIGEYFHKGDRIAISGRLQTRTYPANDGTNRYVTEIVLEEFDFLNSKSDTRQELKATAQSEWTKPVAKNTSMKDLDLNDDFHMMADDDDVPF